MLVSIVVPSLNSPLIDHVVQGIMREPVPGYEVEVFVVGRDEAHVLSPQPGVQFIDTLHPVSPAAARNIGIKHARGSVVCFLDADCVPARGWLRQLARAFEQGHEVVGGGVILERAGYWALCDDILAFGACLSGTEPGQRRALPSLNMCVSRTALDVCGGFDESFQRPAGEDTDLCLRLRRAGYLLHCEPSAAVYHRHNRRTLWRVLIHLYHFGAAHALLRARYPDMYPADVAGKAGTRLPLLVGLAAPLLAAVDIGSGVLQGTLPVRYWFAVPGLILAKAAWYVGLASRIWTDARHGRAMRTQHETG